MLDWLTGDRNRKGCPQYSALLSTPTRGLPADLAAAEGSESFSIDRENLEREIDNPARRPPDNEPLFTELLEAKGRGLVTITLPDHGGQCLPVFSRPFRAGDYVQTLLASGPSVHYLSSSPLELVHMLRDIEAAGITGLALDRCPRCSIFTVLGTASLKTSGDLIAVWRISKATEIARLNLYFSYALGAARTGRIEIARDVALETVGHVNAEDPRPHLLLGQIAVKLRDRKLLRQAKAFLRFFKLDRWEGKLDEVVRSGSPNFEEFV
jgi:hypothetical protein